MQDNAITVKATVDATAQEAWHYYTESEHVVNWKLRLRRLALCRR